MKKINEIKTKILLLEKAKKLIESGRSYYICWALSDVSHYHEFGAIGVASFCDYIGKALKGESRLEDWLYVYHPKFEQTASNIRKLRMKWIDWMIECLEEDLAKLEK